MQAAILTSKTSTCIPCYYNNASGCFISISHLWVDKGVAACTGHTRHASTCFWCSGQDVPGKWYFLLVLVLTVVKQAAPNNCSTQYQAALQQVLDLREKCDEAAYKDCCEVSYS